MVQLHRNFIEALASSDGDAISARFEVWLDRLGAEVFVPFMGGGVSVALLSTEADEINARLEQAFAEMDVVYFVKLIKGGAVRRILDDAFLSSLIGCYKRRVTHADRATLAKFFPDCCSELDKLGDQEFWSRVDGLCDMRPRPARVAALAIMRAPIRL